ncbi:MAG: MRP family ATP-binding protein [Bacteroidetes bacterium]|nr:MAG: MRP family ATP-binding protein [Bacteroidota bacterium]
MYQKYLRRLVKRTIALIYRKKVNVLVILFKTITTIYLNYRIKCNTMNSILASVKNIILVASGSRGVGKSTIAANLAITLSNEGYATGFFDADLFGSTIPLIQDFEGIGPEIAQEGEKIIFSPPIKFGVKIMSLRFLINKKDVIDLKLIASNMLIQLIKNTNWGELDYLVFNLPPGNGDISLTLAQKFPGAKILIVITSQQTEITKGQKIIKLFKHSGFETPILGIVENMSYFIPEKHPDDKYKLFSQEGGKQLSKEQNIPLVAQIPFVSEVFELGNTGKTIFDSSNMIIKEVFHDIAKKINKKSVNPSVISQIL